MYINVQLQYYGVATPDNLYNLSDSEYMTRLAILEDIRAGEKQSMLESGGLHI